MVAWWLQNPQSTRPTVILAVQTESLKSYIENPSLVLEIVRPCPKCMTRSLSRHGSVGRWVCFVSTALRITVFRMRCRPCGLTVTLLPDFLLPFGHYAVAVVETAVGMYLAGVGGYRAVAVALTGAGLAEDELRLSNPTDTVDAKCLRPGHQRVHAWVARVAERAVPDVQVAAAWATTRVPTSTVVDQQTTPLTPPHAGQSQGAAKRADLGAARMLVRIFAAVPELNPAGTGWFAAWQRFVAVVIRRTPWAPSRSPPEPHSS